MNRKQLVLTALIAIGFAVLGALAGVILGGGESEDEREAVATFGSPLPPPTDFEATYKPKPGDLLFVTNGSVAYNSAATHPWVVIIDTKTKKIVAASEISDVNTSPHGIGMSADATQIYLPAGSSAANYGGVTVVDFATLKTTQVIETKDRPHHLQTLNDQYVMGDAWGVNQVLFLIDPAQGNKIVKEIDAAAFGGRPYIGFPTPDGKSIYMTVRPPTGSSNPDAWISRLDVDTWTVEKIVDIGEGAVWTVFTRDGQFAYVTAPHDDEIVKVDLAAKKVIGRAPVGRGPYGATLSPDEKTLFVVSKGEGGNGQRGGSFVEVDAEAMRTLVERPSCTAFLCQPDHALVSPNGKELWISNNMGYITIFDIKTLSLIAEVTMPLLSDAHGGFFVQYDSSGKGHVVMDTGGPHGGVSPYAFDNQNGVPSLEDALAKGWAPAKSSSALVLGAKPLPVLQLVSTNTVDVTMRDFSFDPLDKSVAVGTRQVVTFRLTNTGQAAHNFRSNDFRINEAEVEPGGKEDVQGTAPSTAGTYKFVCTYHPGMELSVTVR